MHLWVYYRAIGFYLRAITVLCDCDLWPDTTDRSNDGSHQGLNLFCWTTRNFTAVDLLKTKCKWNTWSVDKRLLYLTKCASLTAVESRSWADFYGGLYAVTEFYVYAYTAALSLVSLRYKPITLFHMGCINNFSLKQRKALLSFMPSKRAIAQTNLLKLKNRAKVEMTHTCRHMWILDHAKHCPPIKWQRST